MASKRHGLAQRRKSIGLSQETLAHKLRVERSTVARWERGETEPQPWLRPRIASALEISLEQLDILLGATDNADVGSTSRAHLDYDRTSVRVSQREPSEINDMNRRELLRTFSRVSVLVSVSPIEDALDLDRIERAAGRLGRLDAGTLDEYAKLNGHLWRVFVLSASKAEVMPLVRKQLDVLSDSLQGPQPPSTHQRLCALAGDLFQLAGEIYFDGNHYTEAAHCYTLAAAASKEATAFDLWACAMTRHAFISVYERKFDEAAPMLDLAAALARRGDSALSTRHWVSVVQAETFAGLGDFDACQRALHTACRVRELTNPMHNGGWLRFDGSRLAEERGTCFVTLGRPELAEAALTDALRQGLSPRRRASALTDLAMIGIQRRDPDRVITYANAALDTARETGSGVISRKLLGLQPHLGPFLSNQQVRQLHTEIRALAERSAAI